MSEQTQQSHSFKIGQKVFIRTVTMYYTGRVVGVTDSEVVLDDAAWIGSSGRWNNALVQGELDEVEPYPETVYVSRGGIIDWSTWLHDLPRECK